MLFFFCLGSMLNNLYPPVYFVNGFLWLGLTFDCLSLRYFLISPLNVLLMRCVVRILGNLLNYCTLPLGSLWKFLREKEVWVVTLTKR
jgi:hypothetical protein